MKIHLIATMSAALAALLCALGVVIPRHPLNPAVLLIGAMLALSGIYALLDAPFMAVLQVLVYAGAVMMLVDLWQSLQRRDT